MFEQHSLRCHGLRANGAYCDAWLWLPSEQPWIAGDADEIWDNEPAEVIWPPDEWKGNIACPRCLSIREYTSEQIAISHSNERLNSVKCLRIDMGCAKTDCKLPVRFYLSSIADRFCRFDSEGIDLDSDIIELLRTGQFLGKCPRGHDLDRLPKPLYKVTKHTGFIPSQHADLHWTKHSSRALRSV
jgi:hypothetical protein